MVRILDGFRQTSDDRSRTKGGEANAVSVKNDDSSFDSGDQYRAWMYESDDEAILLCDRAFDVVSLRMRDLYGDSPVLEPDFFAGADGGSLFPASLCSKLCDCYVGAMESCAAGASSLLTGKNSVNE